MGSRHAHDAPGRGPGDGREPEGLAALLAAQADALAGVIAGQPLVLVLDDLLRAVERASPHEVMASVLLLDDDGRHLRHGAAPSLPPEYNAAIDGVEIGPSVGSCGTAAYRRARVVVSDIDTDPLWDDFRELAHRFGLRACWSTPIIGSGDEPLGTFALYAREPRRPDADELAAIDVLVGTFALVIERSRAGTGTALQDAAARRLVLELAMGAGGLGTFDWDLGTGALVWDGQLFDIFDVAPADRERPMTIEDFYAGVHPADRDRVRAALDRVVGEGGDFETEYRVVVREGQRWVSARGRAVADRTGATVRVVGAAQDTTSRKD
ncbi:MAG: GAF domain-containing protein, partial [Angustibacter sp.]